MLLNDYNSGSSCSLNSASLGPSLAEMCGTSTFITFISLLNEIAHFNDKISGRCERVDPIKTPDEAYDFVVIGGGGAGAVVAARLSEDPGWKVLLLEAGPDEPSGAQIPLFHYVLIDTRVDWNYTTSNESYACLATNGSCSITAGKMLGGGTAHYGMTYIRGNPKDYDHWAALGNEGWTWEDVKPFFLKSEDNGEIERVGKLHHATGGPLSVERFPYLPPFGYSILEAAEEVGYGVSEDLNSERNSGFSIAQSTVKNGVRRSSASAFLRPARNRKNLHVSINSLATRVIVENETAVGVEYHQNGVLKTVRVTREVVVSAGTIMSPQILLLSGIGPADHLQSVGVNVVKDLPGVGENLQDHVAYVLNYTIDDPDVYDNDWEIAREYIAMQTGPLSCNGLEQITGLLPSKSAVPDEPDLQLYFTGNHEVCAPGRISLASNDPFQYPVMWLNYLSDPSDVDGLVQAVEMGLKMAGAKSLQAHNFTLTSKPIKACSDHVFQSYEYWACAVRQDQVPELHLGGSCKMGPSSDPLAVVDPRLRVHGIKGLRVADNSIMPQVTLGNTGAPAMMIGERAADFIKKYWAV